MKVSFIIPLYNGLALTQAMLASLRPTLPGDLEHEIIFVDDGSSDGTAAWLATVAAPLRAVSNEQNLGFASACNRGADAATGDVLFFLNNDLEMIPGWFAPMLAALRRGPPIGVVGNRQVRVDNGALDHAGLEVTLSGKIRHDQTEPRGRVTERTLREVPGVTAACLAIRREVFQQAGQFDRAFVNGGEDVDLCFRLRTRYGLRAVVALGSVVRHHVSASRGPTAERDERNSRLLAQRWHGPLVRWGARTWARAQVPHLARPWTADGRAALGALPFLLGWTERPPLAGRLLLESGLHREAVRWTRLLDLPPNTPRAPRGSSGYRAERFFRDELDLRTAWLRDRARLVLPPGFPVSNIFLNGFVLPVPADWPETDRPIGFRIRVNGRQVAEFPDLPLGHFNLGLDAPFVLPGQPTRVEVELLGVDGTNFLAWAGRTTAALPLPDRCRARLERARRQALNRRLRFAQLVCDDEVIFDFLRDPPLAPSLRHRPAATGLNVIGWLRAAVGVGESARCMVRACDAAGLPVAPIDLRLNCLNRLGDDSLAGRLGTASPHSVNVFHADPPVSDQIDHHHGPELRADRYNIAYWAWELPEFPEPWVRQCAYFDEIWCPSEFVRAAIAPKVPLPVLVMPHAIGFPAPEGDARARFGLPAGRFQFLFAYDLNSYQERKNPLAVVAAYRRAFPDEAGAGLVIKTQNRERHPESYAQLEAAVAGLKHVTLITETLDAADIHRLQQACDAFVSLHRSEGFGLGLAECMHLGKPVIATDWSATAEYINERNGCPVRYRLIQLQESHGPYAKGQTWADPDIGHAAEWMRRLVDEPGLAARLGTAARATIAERFSPAVIGARYRQRLDTFALWPE
jgi:GT2 family glycosyltransferase/glycosyltransferase involved in cell wall biosynthesis